jgi:uncharacterized repeat protein (TIGR03803 family)
MVMDTLQQRISKMRLGAASAGLTLAFVLGLGMVASESVQAQTFTVLYSFGGNERKNEEHPYAHLARDSEGNLYGTTSGGGRSYGAFGTVFKVSETGKETVLHSFTGSPDDGQTPYAGVVRDKEGNLYGTTLYGGVFGSGTVFKVNRVGEETVLHSFVAPDGYDPFGGLLLDKKNNLYGTTAYGGISGCGTVFKLNPSSALTVLHSFAGGSSDGCEPVFTSLIMDAKHNLYGITYFGGTYGSGAVYKLTKTGALTVLHSFAGYPSDGCKVYGSPAIDKKGNLYGTASGCGSNDLGIVWKVSQQGTETVLHNFAGYPSDGANPYAGVLIDAKGNLYGTTYSGGSSDYGTVYELSKKGKLTLLHSFAESDGIGPIKGLLRDAKGNFYGTAVGGGSHEFYGSVWKLTP